MILSELKAVCAAYHERAVADLTVNSVDLFLVAANNVRRNKGELLHNFEYARCTATLVVNGTTGGSLDDAIIDDGYGTFSKVKEVVACSRMRPDGTYIPLDFARADIPIERDRTELEFSDNLFPYLRYPSDARINSRGTSSSVIQRGRKILIHPYYVNNEDANFNMRLEAYGLLPDYTDDNLSDDEPTDFFVEYGAQFMQWSIINELNYLFKSFVTRQEGNVSAPTQMAADAWRDLLLWDTYQVDANTTRSR